MKICKISNKVNKLLNLPKKAVLISFSRALRNPHLKIQIVASQTTPYTCS